MKLKMMSTLVIFIVFNFAFTGCSNGSKKVNSNTVTATTTTKADPVVTPKDTNDPDESKPGKTSDTITTPNKSVKAVKTVEDVKSVIGVKSNKKSSSVTSKKTTDVKLVPVQNGSRPYMSLTFDDGFDQQSIEKILDALKSNNVRCTFFVIGKLFSKHPDLWKRAIKDGNQICNHTFYHQNLTALSDDAIKKELLDWEEAAKKTLGDDYVKKMKKEFPYFRAPGGSSNQKVQKIITGSGYRSVRWSIDTIAGVLNHHDLKNTPLDLIANECVKYVSTEAKKGSIVLLHFNKYDAQKIDEMIKGIQAKGLKIKLLSELFQN